MTSPGNSTEEELEYVQALLDIYAEEVKIAEQLQVGDLDVHYEYIEVFGLSVDGKMKYS